MDGHADPNADAHQMRIDAHLMRISAYNANKSTKPSEVQIITSTPESTNYPFKLSDVTLPATLTESVFCTQIFCVIANWRLQNDLYEMDV